MNKNSKILSGFVIIFLTIMAFLMIFTERHIVEHATDVKIKQDIVLDDTNVNLKSFTVEKNGISFENGTLIISALNKENEPTKITYHTSNYNRIIEVQAQTKKFFILKSHFSTYDIRDYFSCPNNKTWNKFIRLIEKKGCHIGFGLDKKNKLYILGN